MDFSIYITTNTVIPVSDSYLYEYCTNCSPSFRFRRERAISEKRDRSRDEEKQNKENKKKTISRCTTVKQKYTSGQRLLSVC
jgi:hypothetical protein